METGQCLDSASALRVIGADSRSAMRLAALFFLALAGCTAVRPGAPGATSDAVLVADRAFAADIGSRPLDAAALNRWTAYFTPDAVRLALGGAAVQGREAVRTWDAPLFRDPTTRLLWRPTAARIFDDRRTAVTTGLSWLVRPTAAGADTLYRGTYVTVWQRSPDGRWRVLLDTGGDR